MSDSELIKEFQLARLHDRAEIEILRVKNENQYQRIQNLLDTNTNVITLSDMLAKTLKMVMEEEYGLNGWDWHPAYEALTQYKEFRDVD